MYGFENNDYFAIFDCNIYKRDVKTFIIIAIYEFILNFRNTFSRKNEGIYVMLFFNAIIYSSIFYRLFMVNIQ